METTSKTKKKPQSARLLALRAKIRGEPVTIELSAFGRCYGLKVGGREIYASDLAGLLSLQMVEEVRHLLARQESLQHAIAVERGLRALGGEIGRRLDLLYQGLPPAQRRYAPPVAEAREDLKKLVKDFVDEEQEGHPSQWLEFLKGPAAYAERLGLRLCVLPISPEEQRERYEQEELRREQARRKAKEARHGK